MTAWEITGIRQDAYADPTTARAAAHLYVTVATDHRNGPTHREPARTCPVCRTLARNLAAAGPEFERAVLADAAAR